MPVFSAKGPTPWRAASGERAIPGNVVYDNERGSPDGSDPVTTLGGGSIVVHKK